MFAFALLGCASAATILGGGKPDMVPDVLLKDTFLKWIEEFEVKSYMNVSNLEQEEKIFNIWVENLRMIENHNSDPNATFTMKMNQFGGMDSPMFHRFVHGSDESCMLSSNRPQSTRTWRRDPMKAVPDSIDWTKKQCGSTACVTPVKNQKSCGSCWAFSTTGSLEARYAIKNNELNSLSEQQLIDCSKAEGNLGCNGGLMDNAFKYVEKEGGLCLESAYPYKAKDGTCKATSCGKKYNDLSSYTDVVHDNSADLQAAVAEGPVSIAVEADQSAFQFYAGGVLSGRCGDRLDHGVLVVGYGTMEGKEYWKVKNSWGATWGSEGYLLICKDCNKNRGEGECGILHQPSFPVF